MSIKGVVNVPERVVVFSFEISFIFAESFMYEKLISFCKMNNILHICQIIFSTACDMRIKIIKMVRH